MNPIDSIEAGDLIVAIDGENVQDQQDLAQVMNAHRRGGHDGVDEAQETRGIGEADHGPGLVGLAWERNRA